MLIAKIDPQLELVYIDVKRCRRSCLIESTEEWPVFCAHDEIRENNQALFDFNWIDKGLIKTAKRKLTSLPYQGARWYSKLATQWLLMRGIVTWDDIQLGFDATAHLPANTFKQPLETIEEVMDPLYRKKAINSLLGVWSVDGHYTHVVTTQQDKEALNYQGKVIVRELPCGLYDVIYRQENVTTS